MLVLAVAVGCVATAAAHAAPSVGWIAVPDRVGAGPLPTRFRIGGVEKQVRVELVLRDQAGREWRAGSRRIDAGTYSLSWPLRAVGGGRLPPGAYRAILRLADVEGAGDETAPRAFLRSFPVVSHPLRRVEGRGGRVALTFDDCNDGAAWSRILDTLAARHATGTFFCLGSQIRRHAGQARRALRERHTIGNHTWSHVNPTTVSAERIRRELARSTNAWWAVARAAPMPFFRPPYGSFDGATLAGAGRAGYRHTVLWDVDPRDWQRPGAAAIAARVVGAARRGSIVVLHTLPQTAEALPSMIARLREQGLEPVGLDELVRPG